MVLRVARAITHRFSGIYILKECVPIGLRQRRKGTRVALPIGGETTHVTVGREYVELSLRTRNPAETPSATLKPTPRCCRSQDRLDEIGRATIVLGKEIGGHVLTTVERRLHDVAVLAGYVPRDRRLGAAGQGREAVAFGFGV